MKSKYYVVWVGKVPGIYTSWADCQVQVHGFPEAKYKSFSSLAEANAALKGPVPVYPKVSTFRQGVRPAAHLGPKTGIAVDAACSGNPGVVEYRAVDLRDSTIVFSEGPIESGTNNLGEFLAIVQAMQWLMAQGRRDSIYSDSQVAMGWVEKRAVKSPFVMAHPEADISQQVAAALAWLDRYDPQWDLRKWNTQSWGEIPADYGRK
jgi:ribonuclease HI